ncbi:DUF3159 domain-containing protein [Okibacterium endophyticum]
MSTEPPTPPADPGDAPSESSVSATPSEDGTAHVAASVADNLAAAARRSGLDQLAEEQAPNGRVLLRAMGGVRGIFEVILPGIAFLVMFTATNDLVVSVAVPVCVSLVAILVRFLQKSQVTPALGGLVGLVISAALALRSGEGRSYYELGFWTNGAYGAGLLISVLIGWPLIGLVAGALMGEGIAWKKQRRKRIAFQWITLVWVGFFALRLVVQVPLYIVNDIVALGITRLVMGPPLYGVLLVLTWLYVRAMYRRSGKAVVAD